MIGLARGLYKSSKVIDEQLCVLADDSIDNFKCKEP